MDIQRDSQFFFAHSGNRGNRLEPMPEHLEPVSLRAAKFAAAFGPQNRDQARAMGLVHDIGKYSERFRRRVTGNTPESAGDHATAGAVLALKCYKHLGCMPAAAILGHHGGLGVLESDWRKFATALADGIRNHPESVTEADVGLLVKRFRADGFNFPDVTEGLTPRKARFLAFFDILGLPAQVWGPRTEQEHTYRLKCIYKMPIFLEYCDPIM